MIQSLINIIHSKSSVFINRELLESVEFFTHIMHLFTIINKQKNQFNMKGGRDRRQPKNQDVLISKALSRILRHGAVEEGLTIDSSGYVPMQQVLQYLRGRGYRNIDQQRIRKIVDTSDKKRFEIQERKHHVFIRATQGHSMKIVETEELLKRIEDPSLYPVVIHGTFSKFWPLIKQEGLKRMNRNHIHFAPGLPKQEGVISGMRSSCDTIIQINMQAAMKDGIPFYISSNNVILTEGIDGLLDKKYFLKVFKKDGTLLLQAVQIQKVQKIQEKEQIQTLAFKKKVQQ